MTHKEIADLFRTMADRIEKNDADPFGGAVVAVGPGEDGTVVQLLKIDPIPNPTAFWAELIGRCEEAVNAQPTMTPGFPRR
jgi:hypothetical protein